MIPVSDLAGDRRSFPYVNVFLILANLLVFFLLEAPQPSERSLVRFLSAYGVVPAELVAGTDVPPPAAFGIVYSTLLTSLFLHGGLLHLGSNMLFLWVFGDNVEDRMGHLMYLVFYLGCGVLASLVHVAIHMASTTPTIGASGAISGVLAAYLVLFPAALVRVLLIIPPFVTMTRLSALILIVLWFALQLFSAVATLASGAGDMTNVAFWAHVGGFAAGFVLVRLMPHARRRGAPIPS